MASVLPKLGEDDHGSNEVRTISSVFTNFQSLRLNIVKLPTQVARGPCRCSRMCRLLEKNPLPVLSLCCECELQKDFLFYSFFLRKIDQYCNFPVPKVDQYWHEDCLKCGCCNCRLGEVRSSSSFWNHNHKYYSWTPCGCQLLTTFDAH